MEEIRDSAIRDTTIAFSRVRKDVAWDCIGTKDYRPIAATLRGRDQKKPRFVDADGFSAPVITS